MYIIRVYTDADDFFTQQETYENPVGAHGECVLLIKNGFALMCEVVHLYTLQLYCTVYANTDMCDNSQELIN